MKLQFVGTNRGPGGTESHLISLSSAMADAGHEISAVVRAGDYIDRALSADERINRFDASFKRSTDLKGMRALFKAVRSARPDWLIATFAREYWPVALVGSSLRIPVLIFRHLDEPFRKRTTLMLPRFVYRIVAPSEFLRDRMVTRGMPRESLALLHNPVDTSIFKPDELARRRIRERLGFSERDVVVGFAGRLERQKGVHTLFAALESAMPQCPSMRALWIGSGKAEHEIDAAVESSVHRRRHQRIAWTTDMPSYYRAMDVLAFPSLAAETFGRVSIEAQACGVTVVASRTGGVPETLIPGQTGMLVSPGDAHAWTNALLALATDEVTRARMGAAARDFVCENFDGSRIARDLSRLLASHDASKSN